MKNLLKIILSLTLILTATLFVACKEKGSSESVESCSHSFSANSYACNDRVCLVCGVKVQATEEHNYVDGEVKAPTCTEDGYTLAVCGCGETTQKNFTPKLGHQFGEYELVQEPTCQSVGVSTAKCSRCNETDNVYEEALSHSLGNARVENPTCTENGYTCNTCTVCGNDLYSDFTLALGHTSNVVDDQTIEPTCEEEGYDSHVCERCGDPYTDNFVDAEGHDYQQSGSAQVSCQNTGYTKEECSKCHVERVVGVTDQKSKHKFVNGVCEYCQQTGDRASCLTAVRQADSTLAYVERDDDGIVTRYVVYGVGAEEVIRITVDKEVIEQIVAEGKGKITLRFYNPDDKTRQYVWQVIGLHTEIKFQNNFEPFGYSNTCVQEIELLDENGEIRNYAKEGLTFTLYHKKVAEPSLQTDFASTLGIAIEFSEGFNLADKTTWVTTSENSVTVDYQSQNGWKISTSQTQGTGFSFVVSGDVIREMIATGKTTLTLTFGSAWDGYTGGNPVRRRASIIPTDHTNSENWGYKSGYIAEWDKQADGKYSVSIDLTDENYDFTKGIKVYLERTDLTNATVSVCYLYDVSFS